MKENDIEDMFKEKFDDFEPEVDSKVWKNVKTGIKVAGAGAIGKFLISKLGTNALIAIVSSVATVIGTVAIMNWTGTGEEKPIAEKPNVVVAPPKQLTPQEIKEFLKTEEANASALKEQENQNAAKEDNFSETVTQKIKPKSIANIQASQTSGTAPLAIDVVNLGAGKKNVWMLGDKKNNNESPAYLFDKPGSYVIKLMATNADGQTQRDSIKIEVLPNSVVEIAEISFTPNGDGKKDYFSVAAKHILELDAEILDKDGKLVYKWSGIDGKWDGKNMKGELATAGTYYYKLNSVDAAGNKAENKGTVKLIR